MSWRPDDWPKCPCDDCDNKEVDDYGYVCAVWCHRRAEYFNKEAGADAMLEALWKLAKESPTKTFTLDSRVVNIFGVFIPKEEDK